MKHYGRVATDSFTGNWQSRLPLTEPWMVTAGTVKELVGAERCPGPATSNPILGSIGKRPSRNISGQRSAQWNKPSIRYSRLDRSDTWHFARDIRLAAVSLHQRGIAIIKHYLISNNPFGVMHLNPIMETFSLSPLKKRGV